MIRMNWPLQLRYQSEKRAECSSRSQRINTNHLRKDGMGSERKTNGGRQAREWKSKEINVKEDFPWKWIKVSQWNGRSKVMRLMDIINSTLFKMNSFCKADIFGYLPRNRVQQGIYFIIKMLYKILLKQEYFSILFQFNILWTVIFVLGFFDE